MAATVEYKTPATIHYLYSLVILAHINPVGFFAAASHTIEEIVLDTLHGLNCPNCRAA